MCEARQAGVGEHLFTTNFLRCSNFIFKISLVGKVENVDADGKSEELVDGESKSCRRR